MKNWREVVITFGKHKGWTMFQAYVNDFNYVFWLSQQSSNGEVFDAARAAVNHKSKADPFSYPARGELNFNHAREEK